MAETVTTIKVGPDDQTRRPEVRVVRVDDALGRRVRLGIKLLGDGGPHYIQLDQRSAYELSKGLLDAARWAQRKAHRPPAPEQRPKAARNEGTS